MFDPLVFVAVSQVTLSETLHPEVVLTVKLVVPDVELTNLATGLTEI